MKNWDPHYEQPRLTPEEIINWLDGHRQFMWEIWKQNPELRKRWEFLQNNSKKTTNEAERLPDRKVP